MKAQEMVGLTSSAFPVYEDVYSQIQERRDVSQKRLALGQRIEKVEVSTWGSLLLQRAAFTTDG
jgi:hypothetical protein